MQIKLGLAGWCQRLDPDPDRNASVHPTLVSHLSVPRGLSSFIAMSKVFLSAFFTGSHNDSVAGVLSDLALLSQCLLHLCRPSRRPSCINLLRFASLHHLRAGEVKRDFSELHKRKHV